jgi:DNA-binding IclR family transcriptional regulator
LFEYPKHLIATKYVVFVNMKPENRPTRRVQAAETAFTILETLNQNDGMRLTELAEELGMAKSTIHRYLQTLLANEYVVKEQNNEYHLSLRFLDFGFQTRNRNPGYQLAEQKVKQLAEETNERAQFIVEEHGKAVYVHREAGSHAIQTDPGIGKRVQLHATAAGKSIMAEWSDERIKEYIEENELSALTSNTITDEEALLKEIEKIRERGYSVNHGENIDGLRALGVSIVPGSRGVLGAFSVSGPINRLDDEAFEKELTSLLMGFANEVELNLEYT